MSERAKSPIHSCNIAYVGKTACGIPCDGERPRRPYVTNAARVVSCRRCRASWFGVVRPYALVQP